MWPRKNKALIHNVQRRGNLREKIIKILREMKEKLILFEIRRKIFF